MNMNATSTMGMDDMCMMMQMYFYMSADVTILFEGWVTNGATGLYVLSLIFIH